MTPPTYIVGSLPVVVEDEQAHTAIPLVVWYYMDTRDDIYADEYSNLFISTTNPSAATKFGTYMEAMEWIKEMLRGNGTVYRVSSMTSVIPISTG